MTRPALSWWRLELDADGRVVSVRLVETPGQDGNRVIYREASSEEDALRVARNACERLRMQRNRAAWRKAGKCIRCGRDRDVKDRKACSTCLARQSGENNRRDRRKRGEIVPVPSRADGLQRRRDADRAAIELELLEAMDDVWRKRGTLGAREWLRKQLARRRTRSVA